MSGTSTTVRQSYQIPLNPKKVSFVCQGKNIAGIIEGEGTLIEPTQERYIKGKQNNPSNQIALKSKDVSKVMQPCQVIGQGR